MLLRRMRGEVMKERRVELEWEWGKCEGWGLLKKVEPRNGEAREGLCVHCTDQCMRSSNSPERISRDSAQIDLFGAVVQDFKNPSCCTQS